jgi:hypothetical protein
MRRFSVTSAACLAVAWALLALPVAAAARPPLTVTRVRADWIGSAHRLFIDTRWAPASLATTVTVTVSVGGARLRTLQVRRWVIGRKLFELTVPAAVAAGSRARIEVRASSAAGADRRSVTLDLP